MLTWHTRVHFWLREPQILDNSMPSRQLLYARTHETRESGVLLTHLLANWRFQHLLKQCPPERLG
jgi:hypothetical protein